MPWEWHRQKGGLILKRRQGCLTPSATVRPCRIRQTKGPRSLAGHGTRSKAGYFLRRKTRVCSRPSCGMQPATPPGRRTDAGRNDGILTIYIEVITVNRSSFSYLVTTSGGDISISPRLHHLEPNPFPSGLQDTRNGSELLSNPLTPQQHQGSEPRIASINKQDDDRVYTDIIPIQALMSSTGKVSTVIIQTSPQHTPRYQAAASRSTPSPAQRSLPTPS